MAVFLGGWSFTLLYALMFLEDALKFLPVYFRIKKRKWMKNLTHAH
jgi:Na+-driven multidrug efflux pump